MVYHVAGDCAANTLSTSFLTQEKRACLLLHNRDPSYHLMCAMLCCAVVHAVLLMQLASRDTMLNRTWVLITSARRTLAPPGSTGTAPLAESAAPAAETSTINWSAAVQSENLETATKEAMSAVQHAAVRVLKPASTSTTSRILTAQRISVCIWFPVCVPRAPACWV